MRCVHRQDDSGVLFLSTMKIRSCLKVEKINKETGNTRANKLKDEIIMVRMNIFLLCVKYQENVPKVDLNN